MSVDNLKELYLEQLQDLASANRQALRVTRELAAAARDPELAEALQSGVAGIESGLEAIGSILADHGADAAGAHCKGMEGLVAEARHHALHEKFGDGDVRDAMIITQYQRMMHYAIAGYGTVLNFADRLGDTDAASKLKICLENTRSGDKHMTAIAERRVNEQAMAG